jgi:hypothetical protein
MQYEVELFFHEGIRKASFIPADYRGVIKNVGSEEFWSFKLTGQKGDALPYDSVINTSLIFLSKEARKALRMHFLVLEGTTQIGFGKFKEPICT